MSISLSDVVAIFCCSESLINCLAQIAILCREFVKHRFGSINHSLLKSGMRVRVASFEQQSHVAHSFLVLFRSAKPFDAGTKAAFDVILQTRPRRFAVDLDVAGAQLERSIDYIDRFACKTCRQKGSEIKCAIALDATRDHHFRKRLVDGQLQMRIRLVVLEFDVVTRLVLFDERGFEDQRFDFIVGDDEFEICDLSTRASVLRSNGRAARK